MGTLNTVESMAIETARPENAKVAQGLIEELHQHPKGIGGLIQCFQRNGMGPFVEQWCAGQTLPPNPTAIENGLHSTGMVESVAERTGLAHGVVRGSLAIVIPLLMHHMVSNSHVSPTGEPLGPQPQPHGLLQSVLQRIP
jgi:uncharacterized protein YidB (DUF937 family)